MNKLIIYHGNCTDGWTSAWSAWMLYGGLAEYVQYFHNAVADFDVDGRDVFFLDCCPPRDKLNDYIKRARSVRVLDHHVTMMELCGDMAECTFDMNRSGAGISWDFFHGHGSRGLAPIVDYVEDRDIWRWSLPHSREISSALGSYPVGDFALWSDLNRRLIDDPTSLINEGLAITRMQNIQIDSYKRDVSMFHVDGFDNIPVVNASGIVVSDLLNCLSQPESMAVSWHRTSDGRYKYSLRSKGDFNVAKIAEKYGGGGHKNASAFMSPLPPWELWFENF